MSYTSNFWDDYNYLECTDRNHGSCITFILLLSRNRHLQPFTRVWRNEMTKYYATNSYDYNQVYNQESVNDGNTWPSKV